MALLDFFRKPQNSPVSHGRGTLFVQTENQVAIVHDSFIDPVTGRGGVNDKAYAAQGHFTQIPYLTALAYYKASWFIQNVVDRPARDAVREWFTVKCDDPEFSRRVINRLDELNAREVLEKLLHYQRLNSRGSMILAVAEESNNLNGDVSHQSKPLDRPHRICKLNVTQNGDSIHITIPNKYDVTKADYNEAEIRHYGAIVHRSRYRWICDGFDSDSMYGMSVVQRVIDTAKVLDSATTSSGRIMQNLSNYVVNSSDLVGMNNTDRLDWLTLFKRAIDTDGVIALSPDESISKITASLSGIGEAYDFIQELSAGSSAVPKAVVFGRAFGVVSAGDFDQLNYAAQVKAEIQEKHLRPVLYWLIDLLCKEEQGEVGRYVSGKGGAPDWEIEFNDIFKIDPATEAQIRLSNAQADQIDSTIGKATSDELREKDPRYTELVEDEEDDPEDEELTKELGGITDQAFNAIRSRGAA